MSFIASGRFLSTRCLSLRSFRDYKRVGYYPQIVPTTEPIIIGSKAQEEQLKSTYGDRYDLLSSGVDEGAYPLRPGVDLLLYVRGDIAR